MMPTYLFARSAALLALAVAATPAVQAGSTSAAIRVSAVVEPTCDIAAGPLTFVGARSKSASVDAESGIRLRCSPDLAYSVRLDTGANANGIQRRMIGSRTGKFLTYAIYSDAARTRPWNAGGHSGVAPRDGSEVLIPAFGSISEATAEPDSYTDTVTVSLEF